MSNHEKPKVDESGRQEDSQHPDALDPAQQEQESIPAGDAASEQAPQDAAQSPLEAANDRVLRLQAEMENVRKRAQRELVEERKYALMPLIRDLLPVIDNIRRAISAAESSEHGQGLLEGVQLMDQQLQSVLQAHNCQPIEAMHTPFDPNLHEAIQQMPAADFPAGTVIEVVQEGYLLNDRVVRPAQVIVSTELASQNA